MQSEVKKVKILENVKRILGLFIKNSWLILFYLLILLIY